MARVTYVKKARQRYAMVPVRDDLGNQVETLVTNPRTGEPRVTKTGRKVYMKQTIADKTKPLDNLRCDFPGCAVGPVPGEIVVGAAYKHITPRSGPYGGTQRNRHAEHPDWNVWEYSYSRSAQVARAQADMHAEIDDYEFTAESDFDDLRDSLAQMAQEQLDEQEDALANMPEQLQDGSQAEEYRDALQDWVDEIENAAAPDLDSQCEECEGSGSVEDKECEACDGTGEVDDEVTDEWSDEAKDALREAVDGCGI